MRYIDREFDDCLDPISLDKSGYSTEWLRDEIIEILGQTKDTVPPPQFAVLTKELTELARRFAILMVRAAKEDWNISA